MFKEPFLGGSRAVKELRSFNGGSTVDSKQLEHGTATISLLLQALGLEDSHIPTFWLLL